MSLCWLEQNPCLEESISAIESRLGFVGIMLLDIWSHKPMNRRASLLFLLSLSSACGRCDSEKPGPAAPSASVSAVPAPSTSAAPPVVRGGDDVEPVYPKTSGPPDPLAEKLCAALYDVPAKRRAECCHQSPGFSMTSECVRILSHALRDKSVSLDSTAVDACVSAMNSAHEGCAWVGPANVVLPSACDSVVRGSIEEGKRCRSSLECVEGLRCVGVGPTDTGVCRKPSRAGYPCSLAVDTLAAVTRQDGLETHHPECAGYCGQRRCQELVELHGACAMNAACGPDRVCLGGSCEEGSLPAEGKPCAKGACAPGLHCEKGTCAAPKAEGAACKLDTECKGGCIRGDGGKEGTCGMKCGLF